MCGIPQSCECSSLVIGKKYLLDCQLFSVLDTYLGHNLGLTDILGCQVVLDGVPGIFL